MSYSDQAGKSGRIPVQFVEMDMDYCANTYGVAPCTAALGVAATQKCFNTYATCQDPAHFSQSTKTYRFCTRNAAMPVGVQALPLLTSAAFAPQQITPGKGLGVRASVSLSFADMPFHDHGIDPYVTERHYVPEAQGTFWGKFRARNKFYQGRFLRVLTGFIGQPFSWNDFTSREYVIDAFKGPDRAGAVSVVAKDVLKLVDDKKALCPAPNTGTLQGDITATATTAILAPLGIGNQEYPAAGRVVISGEGMNFTRAGDTLTFTARDVYIQGAKAHKAGDSVQLVKRYQGQAIQDVLYDLLTQYGTMPASYIDKPAWDAEAAAYLAGVWSTDICEPTGVNTLLGELTEQGLCNIWSDELAHRIRFQALRPQAAGLPTLSDEQHFLKDATVASEDPGQRISSVLVYFGRLDPTRKIDETGNYQTRFLDTNPDLESVRQYGSPAIKTIFSRWFNTTSLGRVEALTAMLLERFGDPPRLLDFKVDAAQALNLGDLFFTSTRYFQDATGARQLVNMMVIQAQEETAGSVFACRAQENVYLDVTGTTRTVIFSVNGLKVNLYDAYVAEFGAPAGPVQVVFHVQPGVTIWSDATGTPALVPGNGWPAGSAIALVNDGFIIGAGGNGGQAVMANSPDRNGLPGTSGGTGIDASEQALSITNNGTIAGGGGGGGSGAAVFLGERQQVPTFGAAYSAAGGGGTPAGLGGMGLYPYASTTAGVNADMASEMPGRGGTPHSSSYPGNPAPGFGGLGGLPGRAGNAGENVTNPFTGTIVHGGAGGPAGPAVVGNAEVHWVNQGTVIGALI